VAAQDDKYAFGAVFNHVLLHQTVIGRHWHSWNRQVSILTLVAVQVVVVISLALPFMGANLQASRSILNLWQLNQLLAQHSLG